jgi:hypothetical protein
MSVQQRLQDVIDSPEQAIEVQLRKHHPGLLMPSVPIPKLSSTEFLANDSGKQVKVKVFDFAKHIIMLVIIDKSMNKETKEATMKDE